MTNFFRSWLSFFLDALEREVCTYDEFGWLSLNLHALIKWCRVWPGTRSWGVRYSHQLQVMFLDDLTLVFVAFWSWFNYILWIYDTIFPCPDPINDNEIFFNAIRLHSGVSCRWEGKSAKCATRSIGGNRGRWSPFSWLQWRLCEHSEDTITASLNLMFRHCSLCDHLCDRIWTVCTKWIASDEISHELIFDL